MLSFLITNSNISLQIISTLSHISSIPRPEEKKNQKTKKREKLSDESIRTRLLHPRNAISPNAISLSSKKVNSSSFSRLHYNSFSFCPFFDGIAGTQECQGRAGSKDAASASFFEARARDSTCHGLSPPPRSCLAACDRGRPNGYLTNVTPITPN